MIPVTEYRNDTVAVFGLGRSGRAAVSALVAGGADVLVDDDSDDRRAGAATLGGRPARLAEGAVADARILVLSPGVPLDHPVPAAARAAGVAVVGETDLFARAVRPGGRPFQGARIVGITGTNGKSTATALVGHLLAEAGKRVQIGGNFGTAALVLDPLDANGVYVLEMSSFQLELTSRLTFDVAGLLNVSPDHLDRHGDMRSYVAAKKRIFRGKAGTCAAVIACDDRHTAAVFECLAANAARRTIAVSGARRVDGGVGVDAGRLIDDLGGAPRAVADLDRCAGLTGDHNRQNAALAYAICRTLGVDSGALSRGLSSFRGLPHRLEPVAEIAGVRYVNDSKATNVAATARALACYRRVYWIAGGRAKDLDIGPLAPVLDRVRHAYLIGEAAGALADRLAPQTAATVCETLERAVALAARRAAAERGDGAVVLLSPVCASYDQFRDFEARGERFRTLVGALAEAAA